METCALNDFFAPAQRARFLEAIPKRRSLRCFSEGPDIAQKSALSYAAARVCLPGVRIELIESAPEKIFRKLPIVGGITGTDRAAVLIVDETAPNSLLHAGISGEAFVLEAVSLGLDWLLQARRDRCGIESQRTHCCRHRHRRAQ